MISVATETSQNVGEGFAASRPSPTFAYKLFISYSHKADAALAATVQRGLQNFAKPWYRIRAFRVFRDEATLAMTPHLWPAIQQALEASEYLLLLASPESARSPWVKEEIGYWLQHKSLDTLFIIVTTSSPLLPQDAPLDFRWVRNNLLPSTLAGNFVDEPLFADLRWAKSTTDLSARNPRFLNAVASLTATLTGREKDELIGEDVRQHRRLRRLGCGAVALLTMVTIASLIAANYAVRQRASAEERAQINFAQRLAAQAELVRPTFPKRSALLAAEALKVAQTSKIDVRDAEEAARRSLSVFYDSKPHVHHGLRSLAVSPDGRWLATGGENTLLQLWDLNRPESPPRVLKGHLTAVSRLSFSPDSKWLVSGGKYWSRAIISKTSDNQAFLWNLSADNPSPAALKGNGVAIGFAFLNSSSQLAVLFSDGGVAAWKLEDVPKPLSLPLTSPDLDAKTLAVDSSGTWIAIGYRNGTARLWRQDALAVNGATTILGGHDDPVVHALTFSPDGRWLITISSDLQSDSGAPPTTSRQARLWDLRSVAAEPHPIVFEIRGSFHRVWQVEFSSDSKWLMMRAETADLRVWRMPSAGTELPRYTLEGSAASASNELLSAAFSPDGRYLAAGSRQGLVHIWSMDKEEPRVWRTFSNSGVDVTRLTFSPDGKVLFAGGRDGWIRVWQADGEGGPLQTAVGHEGAVSDLRLVGQGEQLLSASFADATVGGVGDESVREFRLDSSQLLAGRARILRTPETSLSVSQSADKLWVVSGYTNATLVRIPPKGLATDHQVPGTPVPGPFSSSGEWLATRVEDGVRLTNLHSLKTIMLDARKQPGGDGSKIVHVAFAPDSSRILVVESRSAKLYDIKGPLAFKLTGAATAPDDFEYAAPGSRKGDFASSISMSQDGRWLLAIWRRYPDFGETGDPRGVASLWDFRHPLRPKEHKLDVPMPHSGSILSNKIVVSTANGSAYVWELPDTKLHRPVFLKGAGAIHPIESNLSVSADGRWAVTLSADRAFLWNIDAHPVREPSAVLGPFEPTAIGGSYRAWGQVRFSSTGRWLAITQKHEKKPHKQLWLLRLDRQHLRVRLLPVARDEAIETVVFDEKDQWMATGGGSTLSRNIEQRDIKLWDLRSAKWGNYAQTLSAHESTVQDFLFVGRYLVSVARDRSVVKWDTQSRDGPSYNFLQLPSRVTVLQGSALLLSPNNDTILVINRFEDANERYSTFESYHLNADDLPDIISRVIGRSLTPNETKRYLRR